MATTRARYGYLSYNDMLTRISDGVLDAYDIVYTYDTKENYIISPDLVPWSVHSRVYTFNSVEEANEILNNNSDTYEGQIISILDNDTYRGYVVNKKDQMYYVVALYEHPGLIDYNTLGNRPIENIIGSLDNPVIINNLTFGFYKVKGQYYITETDETTYLSVDGDLFIIEIENNNKLIKRITKDSITDITISQSSEITSKSYVTDEYLKNNGYTTIDYVDSKVLALEETIENNTKSYIDEVIIGQVDSVIDEKIIQKFDEVIQETSNEEIENLFI